MNSRYNLLHEIGAGGMATVFLADDKKFDTKVAVKILNKELVHAEKIRKRFLAEAKNMFRMSHPNIVKVTDLIDDGDNIAFVMEYIEGETLKEYLDKKDKLSNDEIKNIYCQMLEAVCYVHKQKIIHRDIKPSNFIVGKEGLVKLLDFGISKTMEPASSEYTQTGTGVQMGTPMYMSPEQITETKAVTEQSDIYSLGVVLWQLVTGRKPYDSQTLSSFQLQTKIVNDTLENTNSLWEGIIRKATSKDPGKRHASSEALLEEVRSLNQDNSRSSDETILVDRNMPASDEAVWQKGEKVSNLLVGYFKWEDSNEVGEALSVGITHGNEEKFDDFTFEETYRVHIQLFDESETHEDESSTNKVSEEFLVKSTGRWELKDSFLIKKYLEMEFEPEAENEKVASIIEHMRKQTVGYEAIWEVIEATESVIRFKDIASGTFQSIQRLKTIHKRLIFQENEKYLKRIMDQKEEIRQLLDIIRGQEAFYGGHIGDLNEFSEVVHRCFNIPNVNFNPQDEIEDDCLNSYGFPEEVEEGIILICRFFKPASFLTKSVEVVIAAYVDPEYIDSENPHVQSNLLLISQGDKCWKYSMSVWIDAFRELPCINALSFKDSRMMIESYQQLSKEANPEFKDTIKLPTEVGNAILSMWNEIESRSLI